MKAFCFISGDSASYYMGSDNSAISDRYPFFIPDFDSQFTGRPALMLRIGRVGKSIVPRFASRYFDGIAPAMMIMAPGCLDTLRAGGSPLTPALVFDGSLPHGNPVPPAEDGTLPAFSVAVTEMNPDDGRQSLPAPVGNLCISPAEALSLASATNTVKTGDLIYIAYDSPPLTLRRDTILTIAATGGKPQSGPAMRLKIK